MMLGELRSLLPMLPIISLAGGGGGCGWEVVWVKVVASSGGFDMSRRRESEGEGEGEGMMNRSKVL